MTSRDARLALAVVLGTGGDDQRFQLVCHRDMVFVEGHYGLVARHSGKCLDVEGRYLTNNAKVWQYTCGYGYNQQWHLPDGIDHVRSPARLAPGPRR